MFEVNGNLYGKDGLTNIEMFQKVVINIRMYYLTKLKNVFSENIDLYIDNAISGSGYTPVITPVLNKILIIKLCIKSSSFEAQIAYQFAHEYMHYIFFCKYGLQKPSADEREESICSAASLIVLHDMYPAFFDSFNDYVKALSNNSYRAGADLAEKVKYDINILARII